jgi:hypothetical protein
MIDLPDFNFADCNETFVVLEALFGFTALKEFIIVYIE